MHKKQLIFIALIALGVLMIFSTVSAVGGAAFTTFNAHVDGSGKDVCKNSAINCNIYGAKEYVWLNGGPNANHLKPDGYYFFTVLEPGGQPNPNDQGGLPDKNLSDDYDAYTNRVFRTVNGEVAEYNGTHWLDSGSGGPKPNGSPPYIRLFPYSDTTNPGGVYIMSICYLGTDEDFTDYYPVDPRDCKYDAFKVKKGKVDYSFMLSGNKYEDKLADGPSGDDEGLSGWNIVITGTGPDGLPFTATVTTTTGGYWEWLSPTYSFTGQNSPGEVSYTICEVLKPGWTQSYPGGCYSNAFTPSGFDSFDGYDFYNWYPVDVTACKYRDVDGDVNTTDDQVAVAGWAIDLTQEGSVIDSQVTGADGCYTWTGLTPGYSYDLHEEDRDGWYPLGETDIVFPTAESQDSFSHDFVNAMLDGCTPGFWQGGNDFGNAGGKWYWDEVADPDWVAGGGDGNNPYIWTTLFNDFFTSYPGLTGFTMMDLIGTGGGSVDAEKAGRSLVAAYLNASWGINYAYSTLELETMWATAVVDGSDAAFLALHTELDAANNAYYRSEADAPHCPISASIPSP